MAMRIAAAVLLLISSSLLAQTPTPQTTRPSQGAPAVAGQPQSADTKGAQSAAASATAQSKDVATPEATIAALYDVISGPAGQKRDWTRFRALFAPDARMMIAYRDRKSGDWTLRTITPEEYITMSGPKLEEHGFFEKEIARRAEQYAHVYHAWSTYEARARQEDAKPFMRGINSIQLFGDGKRWWIATVYWEAEGPETPLPERYLRR